MNIFVKTTSGKTLSITIQPYNTIIELKQKIYEQFQIPVHQQNLVYMAEVLKDGETIESAKITDGMTIYMSKK